MSIDEFLVAELCEGIKICHENGLVSKIFEGQDVLLV
jgi:hypothetical protein